MNQTREGEFSPDKLPKSVKVRSTCNACQQAKIRCSHERPSCKRCQKHNIDCVYSISRRLGRPAKKRDPNLDSSAGDGSLSKKIRGPKKKKVKEEPMPDFGANEQCVDNDEKLLFDALALDHNHVDDVSVENASLQTPTYMDIVSTAPFTMSDNIDLASDSWLQEFMSNPFTDPTQGCAFPDPFDSDVKVDETMTTPSMDLDSLPVQSETFSDSTSEGIDPTPSSSYYPTISSCMPHTEPVPGQGCLQGHSAYPEHSKQEAFAWSQTIPSLSGGFGESSLFPQLNSSKRTHDYSFPEEDFKANINSLSTICPCQNHDQAVRDLIRVNACALQMGPAIAIDSILTCQRVLQQLTETILQCRGCSRIRVNYLMVVMLSIDSLITALDTITSAENDVVERLFPEYFGPLAQEYGAEAGLTTHTRRFKGGSVQLRKQLDACPLIIGGFCVPSEEKFVFVKRVLHRRLAALQRTVQRIQVYTQEYLAPSTSRGRVMMMKETYERLQLVTTPNICLPTESSDRIIYHLILASMEAEASCQCSIGALQIMNELRSVHTVVEFERILALVERIISQGQTMLKCKECRANPKSTLMTLPTLADQSLALFEAVCLAYNVCRKDALFDPSLPQFLCIRSKIQLGQMDLDEDEAVVLVRMLLGKSSMQLLDLLKGLRSLLKDCGQSHRTGAATLRACETSVEPSIHRLAMFREQIEAESGSRDCSAWPWALKVTSPLAPTNHFANQGLFDMTFPDSIRSIEVEGGSDIWSSHHSRNKPPTCKSKATSAVLVLFDVVGVGFHGGWWYTKEESVCDNVEWYRCIEILTDQCSPPQLWHHPNVAFREAGMV
ncbi:Zn(II)2Cys6 transcription factor domain-containing protein [Aspergillus undulatus]|uniref:Zn(II)2Cys6 transcription factor domain-containing protein n=1 Tax=Aspergillus undulatus TaxID=1810928 RepID=UPI003CCE2915